MASKKTLHDLFLHQLRDVHYADKHAAKLFSKLAKAAADGTLKGAFETFGQQTHDQVDRLDAIFDQLDKKSHSVPCEAMQGIVEEAKELLHDFEDSEALDAGLVAAGQAVTHYGIARYGTLRTWSMQLGLGDVTPLIDTALSERRQMNDALDALARTASAPMMDPGEGILTPKMAALTGLA
jgi:ferritin-like metal-binding protein YciE